jgi:hypothetical protein
MRDCKHPPLMWFMKFKVDWNLIQVGKRWNVEERFGKVDAEATEFTL